MLYAILNGKEVHIDEVEKGVVGICPICQEKLLAKKGKIRQYFAHPKGFETDCKEVYNILKLKEAEEEIEIEDSSKLQDVYNNIFNDKVPTTEGFTDEQLAIINSPEAKVKVNAKAGSGKSSTAEEYIRRNTDKKILYLVFNRSMMLEAQERFADAGNVEIRTIHSMAYKNFGGKYRDVLTSDLSIFDVAKALKIFMKSPHDFAFVTLIKDMFDYFLTTKYHKITEFIEQDDEFSAHDIDETHIKALTKLMEKCFNKECKVTHNFYLKLWHLSKPMLHKDYDVLIVDEVQDIMGALVDIIDMNSDMEKIILLGDTNQAIYQFAHCVNAFELLTDGWAEYPLSKSFRIGNTLATVISDIMKKCMNEDFIIEGYNKKQKVVEEINTDEPHYVICRNNATILDLAFTSCVENKKIFIAGGGKNVDFAFIKRIYDFKYHNIKHFSLKRFEDYGHMIKYAEKFGDTNILSVDKLIKKYGKDLTFHMEELEKNIVDRWEIADICYTTAHKCKGSTFIIPVKLGNDLLDCNEVIPEKIDLFIPELNLLYVAMTRSKSDLQMLNSTLLKYLEEMC